MSQLFRFVHLFDHFACYGVEPKELLAQSIDELRKSPSVSDRFCIGNVVVKVIAMNSLVTRKAAGFCQSFHAWAKPEAFNFLVKIIAGASGFGSKFLQTNTKERTSRSGRKVRDALSFFKDRRDFFGHVFGWLYSSSCWVDHFAVFPQSDFLAVGADLHKVFNRFVKLKKVCCISSFVLIIIASANDKGFSPLVQLWNHLTFKNTRDATVGTGENIQWKFRSNDR